MSVILRYIEGRQNVGPDTTPYLILFKSNYVFKKLQMQELDFTEVHSHSATDKKIALFVNLCSNSLDSHWPFAAIEAYDIKQNFVFLVIMFIKLQRNKLLSHLSGVPVKTWCRYVCFRRQSLFLNVPYKKAQTTEKNAQSRSWKKTPTSIRVSVSKLNVTFFVWCCSQTEG
jgi:hypothetical protein